MVSPRMRPRFEVAVPYSPANTHRHFLAHLEQPECPVTATLAGNHLHLNMHEKVKRIWSPQLNLEIISDPKGSVIHGHFGPRPDIWTLAMALYAISGFAVLMGIMFAISQWLLDMQVWAGWVILGGILLAAIVYILALIGQWLSQDQMDELMAFVQNAQKEPHLTSEAG